MSVISQTKQRYDNLTIKQKEVYLGYALILPSVLLVAITLVYPLLYNFYLSFTEVPLTPAESPEWIGLENYMTLISDPDFLVALRNTFIFTLFSDIGATVIGLGVALLFTKEFFGRRLARGVVLLPYIAPLIASAFVWQWIWDPTYGVGQFFFADLLGLYDSGTDLRNSLTMVIVFESWRYFPFAFLLILARLQSIPDELYEAAKVDGASRWARFRDITLPELKYVIATVFLIRWIWNFNVFADVWLFTRDVPVLGVFVYQTGFNQFEQGIAAATSMIMLVFLMLFVAIYVTWVIEW
ncbi:carbohydrate ABC transporter permease [Natrarchaeobius chitinivorans]|uniref:Sugar ABC transporter permease n=1 Tax=Natrarchaeobius chitinivorans TaxID=1679083 RepID=A0A3N6M135_NATCH|nr:sugar ABC transporter permease [Natrarchaeobius chitinivorans]RQG95357.1 sugar ABC transporter permease [Natrarchaeobius chitinivorans]